MSIQQIGNIAIGYSRSMDTVAARLQDPEVLKDPGKIAQLNIDMFFAQQGYAMSSKAIQDIHREDQVLTELLRDA